MGRLRWVLFLLIVACGDELGGDDPIDTRPYCDRQDGPYEGVREVFAATCTAMERCDLARPSGYAFECRQECVQAFDFGMTCGFVEEEDDDRDRFNRRLEKRDVIYDEARGARCIDWLANSNCSEIGAFLSSGETFTSDEESDAPCHQVIEVIEPSDPPQGSLTEGQQCDGDYECAEGLYCSAPQSDADAVVCSACVPYPSAGQPCLDHRCSIDAWCDSSVEPNLCMAKRSPGTACEGGHQCASQYCYEGSCIEPGAEGAACTNGQQCLSYVCYQGACITQLEEGAACADDVQCTSNRCYQGACILVHQTGEACQDHDQCWTACYRGTCIDPRRQGEACDEDVHCSNALCYQGVCTPGDQLPEGAPCVTGYECLSDRCISDACVNPRENGQPCSVPEECLWNVCFQGACGLPDGEDCDYREQCRSGRCPNYTFCAQPVPDGGPCTYEDECASYTCLDNVCITRGELDDPCTRNEECDGYLFCDPELGRCAIPRENGERCTIAEACRNEYCDLAANRCGHTAGDACVGDFDCQGFCESVACAAPLADGSTCDRDVQCENYCVYGTCMASKPYFVECVADEECEAGICDTFYSTRRCRGPGQCFGNEDCSASEWCNEDEFPQICAPKKADGERCESDAECTNYCYSYCVAQRPFGSSCVEDAECVGGLCENGSCSEPGLCYSDEQCSNGQICDYSSSRGRCIDKKADGSFCNGDDECASAFCSDETDTCITRKSVGEACNPYECTLDAFCKDGTCQERKRPGASCDSSFYMDLECLAPSVCRRGVCERLSLECQAAPVGRMCTLLMACAEDAYCDLLDGFTCAARYRDGEPCETVLWRANTCFDGSYCNTVCEPYVQIGESCATGACDSRSSFCDASGVCSPLRYQGELCETDEECLGDNCEYNGSDEPRRCGGPCKPPG